jgi:hypothetical protein
MYPEEGEEKYVHSSFLDWTLPLALCRSLSRSTSFTVDTRSICRSQNRTVRLTRSGRGISTLLCCSLALFGSSSAGFASLGFRSLWSCIRGIVQRLIRHWESIEQFTMSLAVQDLRRALGVSAIVGYLFVVHLDNNSKVSGNRFGKSKNRM